MKTTSLPSCAPLGPPASVVHHLQHNPTYRVGATIINLHLTAACHSHTQLAIVRAGGLPHLTVPLLRRDTHYTSPRPNGEAATLDAKTKVAAVCTLRNMAGR